MTEGRIEATLARARRAAPSFGLARQQRASWRARRRSQTKRSATRVLAGVAAAACLLTAALGVFFWFKPSERGAQVDEHWQLRDGSRILLETPDTRLVKQKDSDTVVLFELAGGAARFDVARRPERAFRVQAGPVLVEVIGTAFRVERQGARTLVSVERGRVGVSWSGFRRELTAGQQSWFPPPAEPARLLVPDPVDGASVLPADDVPVPVASVSEPTASTARPTAEALFALADRARTEGRVSDATRALRQLTERFPRDARAPLAAFTLGRLLLENVRQPAEAARAFALARSLAGGSSALAEDALAREVEAWRAAGDASKAAARAQRYQALYPDGAHIKQVTRAGTLPGLP